MNEIVNIIEWQKYFYELAGWGDELLTTVDTDREPLVPADVVNFLLSIAFDLQVIIKVLLFIVTPCNLGNITQKLIRPWFVTLVGDYDVPIWLWRISALSYS